MFSGIRRNGWSLAALPVLCVAVLLFMPGRASATTYDIEKEIALYGDLDQNLVPGWGNVACAPTAAVNSFVYLQNKYPEIYDNLLVPQQGVDLDGDGDVDQTDDMIAVVQKLGGQGYMNTQPAIGTYTDDFFYGKHRYLEEVAPGRTRYEAMSVTSWVNPPNRVPAVPDPEEPDWVASNTAPTWEFLYNELADCEDVEIGVRYDSGGGHCLTLTSFHWDDANDNGIIEQAENAWIDYMDPWGGVFGTSNIWSGSALVGGTVYNVIESDYGSGSWIAFAASESPVPEPVTAFFFGTGLAGVAGIVRRRRRRRAA